MGVTQFFSKKLGPHPHDFLTDSTMFGLMGEKLLRHALFNKVDKVALQVGWVNCFFCMYKVFNWRIHAQDLEIVVVLPDWLGFHQAIDVYDFISPK